jgi:hypothetical protein
MEGLADGKHNKMCSITTIRRQWNTKCIQDFSLEATIWDLKAWVSKTCNFGLGG